MKLTWLPRVWSRPKVVQTAFAKIIFFSLNILAKCWIQVLPFWNSDKFWANKPSLIEKVGVPRQKGLYFKPGLNFFSYSSHCSLVQRADYIWSQTLCSKGVAFKKMHIFSKCVSLCFMCISYITSYFFSASSKLRLSFYQSDFQMEVWLNFRESFLSTLSCHRKSKIMSGGQPFRGRRISG